MSTPPADIAQSLLTLAADDEFMARSLLPIEGVSDAGIGFHAQQAVEKALKAVLAVRGVEFPYTHDLEALLELCDEHGIDAPEDLSEVDRLSPFAVRLRYGAAHTAALDRDRALRWAAIAVKWAQGQVNPETPTESESETQG